jgi:hypothetical protein
MRVVGRFLASAFAAFLTLSFVNLIVRGLLLYIWPRSASWLWVGVTSYVCAAAAAYYVWRETGRMLPTRAASDTAGRLSYILVGAAVVGGTCFALGFLGPMIFWPHANQGPLLGIFITGPLGVVVGAIAGAIYASRRREPT